MGGPAVCQKQQVQILPGATQATPGTTYPGGYCTRQCYADTQCGTGNLCGYYGGEWGEGLNICYHGCSVDADCRQPGYLCLTVNPSGAPTGVCTPSNLSDGGLQFFDAGRPPARTTIGKACAQDSDCQTETKYGSCLKAIATDGGSSGYANGYCTADCTMAVADSWCMGLGTDQVADGGAWCLPLLFTDANSTPFVTWQCVAGCNPAGPACRTGYECAANGLFSSPGNPINTCEPDCTATSDCKSTGGCLTSLGCYGVMCNTTSKACQ
jgi:hypothetical protein